MKGKAILFVPFIFTIFIFTSAYITLAHKSAVATDHAAAVKRYLYVAVPGIRDYLGYGGHGILVFDIDNNHRFPPSSHDIQYCIFFLHLTPVPRLHGLSVTLLPYP